ncbi:MAG: FecR family protein [Methylophilaceae bacterium]|nr:FecR family protein [Methylophilaceae bacterium]
MNTENIFTLKRQAIIALAVATAFPATSFAAAGRVEFAIGGATAISKEGATRSLTKGVDINSGDTIKTTDGRVQVRFTDGGYMSLQPNTEFIVENYAYDGKQDGAERGFFRLVEGGLRAITGVVGRNNRPAYRVATPVATIGIRGSEFLAEHRESRLKVRVIGGSIFIENELGDLILFKGQSAEAKEGEKPGYSEEESGVQAKGPEGGNPQEGENESQAERQLAGIFTVNEQYNEDGISCALTKTCDADGLAAVIASYAAANAVGDYYLNSSSSGSISGGGFSGVFDSGSITAFFGDYSLTGNFSASGIYDDGSVPIGDSFFATFSGDITSSGGIAVTGSPSFYGSFCDATCSIAGLGAFSGSAAENASINFTINGVGGSASGQAVYNADEIIADGGEGAILYVNPNPL